MTRILKEAILMAGENVGNQLAKTAKEEQKGLVSYLEWAAMKQPATYLALLGRIMPMQVEKIEKEVDVYKTVEEVKQALRDRGLPLEHPKPSHFPAKTRVQPVVGEGNFQKQAFSQQYQCHRFGVGGLPPRGLRKHCQGLRKPLAGTCWALRAA
jgi:hypothetical protein